MKVGTDGILLGAWAEVSKAKNILDIGTGTGLIAMMLAERNASASIHAVEISEQSYHQAKDNFERSRWADRLSVFHRSVQDFSRENSKIYDHIICNPPFFTGGTFSDNQNKNSVRHTVKLPHGDLLRSVQQLITADGRFLVILPYIEGLRFIELAKTYHFYNTRITEVIPKEGKSIERLLIQLETKESKVKTDQITLYVDDSTDRSEAYAQLTREFYLD